MLHIRDDAFAQLGDDDLDDEAVAGDAPEFTVDLGRELHARPRIRSSPDASREPSRCRATWRRTATPGGTFRARAGRSAEPERHLHGQLQLRDPAQRPWTRRRRPGRPQVYGHGLLGTASQATSGDQQILGQTHNFVICATDTIGFSSRRRPQHRHERPARARELPAADRPGPAGPPQHAVPGPADDPPRRIHSDAAFHVDGVDCLRRRR